MIVLGIETSCDETAVGIVSERTRLHSNVISSQAALHAPHGGIVPELASRRHLEAINPVLENALKEANMNWKDIDAIAVTYGPGLAGSLIVGLNMAKGLAATLNVPLVGVNHLIGHARAAWLIDRPQMSVDDIGYPIMCLIVSGGHTDMALIRRSKEFVLIGETRDDAAGEAFDKCARTLGLGYPGGPEIERVAKGAAPCDPLPRPWMHNTLDFSFSGLKTALVRRARAAGISSLTSEENIGHKQAIASLARELQESIVDVLVRKVLGAVDTFGCTGLIVGGGVASNTYLRERFFAEANVPVLIPPPVLCTDNGAMIAAAGYDLLESGVRSPLDLDVNPSLRLADGI